MPSFGFRRGDRVSGKRNRCRLEFRDDENFDDRGHVTDDWELLRTLRCEFQFLTGRDAEQARQVVKNATHRIIINWQREGDRLVNMRIVRDAQDGGGIYYIGAVEDPNFTRRQMRLIVSQQLDNQVPTWQA